MGEDDATFIEAVRKAEFKSSAAMLAFPGEDYTTPATIKRTGGLADPQLRPARLELVKWGAQKAKALGLKIMSVHAGFLPEKGDPARRGFLDCLGRAVDMAAAHGVVLAFETGQEEASLLRATLDDLQTPNAKVNFDPANMLLYNKGNPIEAIWILGKDIVHVHAKDANVPLTPGTWGEEVPLGQGQVGMEGFLRALDEVGYHGTLAIEREVGNQEARIKDVKTGVDVLTRLVARF
jgi:L-ribulose-5-phosphate 3-epimerase